MECNNIQEKLSSYIDDRLLPDEKAQVDEHLRGCPECSRSFEELKKTIALTRGLDEVEPPPWLEQKVMANIRQGERRKEGLLQKLFFPVHIKVPLEIVATVAIAVTAFFVFRTIEPEIKTFKRMPEEMAAPSLPSAPVMRKGLVETDEAVTGKMEQHEEAAGVPEEERVPEKLYLAPDVKAKQEAGRFAPGAVGTSQLTEQQHIDMVVRVDDLEASAGRIEDVVKRLHGEIVRRGHFENKEMLSVMIDPDAVEKLLQELKTVGEVQDKGRGRPLENLETKVELRIEVIQAF